MTPDDPPVSPSWPLGCFLVLAGVVGLVSGWSISSETVGAGADPGPAVFPLFLSVLLILGGLAESWVGLRSGLENGFWREPGRNRFLAAVGLLLAFALTVPWVGFSLSSAILVVFFLRLLGTGWGSSLLTALVLIVVVRFLFGWLFRVQLPEGILEPFL